MNRLFVTVWLTTLVGLTTVSAQVDYRPGYVVSLAGDTLRGSIDYRNWLRNPKAIDFQPSAQNAKQTFKPLDIRAFGVAGDIYQSAIVQVDVSPTSVGELTESPEPQIIADTTFIRALITGEKSLYVYHSAKQSGNTEQYYIRKNEQWELLIYKKYIRKPTDQSSQTSARTLVATNKRYTRQLAVYLQECSTIQEKMRNIPYRAASLERLFQAYYECKTTTPAYEKKPEKRPIEFGLLAGGVQTSVKIRSTERTSAIPITRTSFSNDFTFTGGVFLDIVRMRNNRKWSVNNELVYTSFTSSGTYYAPRNSVSYTNWHTTLEYSYLKLNTMIRFKYPIGKVYLFANVGISNSLKLSGSDRQIEEQHFQEKITVYEHKAFDSGDESYDLGFLGGLGVRYQRYSFETRFEKTQGLINYIAMSAPLTRVAFLLSYRLTK